MWIYLSVRNSSFKLPELESFYYLDVNQDLYQAQISNLHSLHDSYGLIVWDPSILQTKWSPDDFYEHINEYMHFCKSCKRFIETGFGSEFMSYLQVKFLLKLLENNIYDLELIEESQHQLFHHLEFMIRVSVHYLWTNRFWNALDQVLLALHHNNALGLLHDDHFLMQLSVD